MPRSERAPHAEGRTRSATAHSLSSVSERLLHGWAVVLLFTLFAGEALRNTLSWYGFAAWAVLVLVGSVVVLTSTRHSAGDAMALRGTLRGAPRALLTAFVLWAALSLVWSEYRLATLLAVVVLVVTTGAAVFLVRRLGWGGLIRALTSALLGIVALSLVFETVVALVGRPILPVFPINVEPGEKVPDAFYWSRALLFQGGRIQGILGNANLLGFAALLLLLLACCLLAARTIPAAVGVTSVVLAALTLALTRSSTVLAAAAACAVVLVLTLLWRRSRGWAIAAGVGGSAMLTVGSVAAAPALLALLGKSDDLTGRGDIWATVAALFLDRPVLGWGWTSYWQPWVPLFQDLAVRNGVAYLQAHNAFLDVAFQLGGIGLVLFVGLVAATGVGVARRGTLTGPVGADARAPGPHRSAWLLGVLLPVLLLTALVVQALTESRLLVEGNWALLCAMAVTAGTAPTRPRPHETQRGAPPPMRSATSCPRRKSSHTRPDS